MRDLIPVTDNHVHCWINRLLKEQALRCPECCASQSLPRILSDDRLISPRHIVACGECQHRGPFGKSIIDAIKGWKRLWR